MARNKYPEQTVKRIVEAASRLFNEKGYEQTTIQDIINELGDLSKGAIYHHFRSKQEILEAMYLESSTSFLEIVAEVRGNKALNGLEKMQTLLLGAMKNPVQIRLISFHPGILKDSRILGDQIKQDISFVAPIFQSLLVEGIGDGSVIASNLEPLSQILILLVNTWLNPLFLGSDLDQLRMRFYYLQSLTSQLGVPLFPDDTVLMHLEEIMTLLGPPKATKAPPDSLLPS